jgi:hypothetical protein
VNPRLRSGEWPGRIVGRSRGVALTGLSSAHGLVSLKQAPRLATEAAPQWTGDVLCGFWGTDPDPVRGLGLGTAITESSSAATTMDRVIWTHRAAGSRALLLSPGRPKASGVLSPKALRDGPEKAPAALSMRSLFEVMVRRGRDPRLLGRCPAEPNSHFGSAQGGS